MIRTHSPVNTAFVIHLILLFLAWTGPFLVWWPIMLLCYSFVILQFWLFNRCLVNAQHGQGEEAEDYTLYGEIFDRLGIPYKAKPLKVFIRTYLNPLLASFTLFWQLGLGIEASWLGADWWLAWF